MRIRQLLSVLIIAIMAPYAVAQDYTPSAEVTAAIVDAQSDGVITDAEAQSLAQAMANDGASATQIAGSMSQNVGTNITNSQIAAGLAAVGQTQGQIAAALTASGVVDNDGDAAQAAQAGQQVAVASGNAVVVTDTVTNNANLTVNGSGLITDSSGRAVVVKSEADQVFLVLAVIRNNISQSVLEGTTVNLSSTVANNLKAIVNSNPSLSAVSSSLTSLIDTYATGGFQGSGVGQGSFDESLDNFANELVSQLPEGTLTAQS